MKQFIDKYQKNIIGSISGWDRIAWRGTNRWLSNCDGLGCYLSMNHILLKDFKGWALDITGKLRESCDALADIWGIRKEYLRSSSVNKEELARRIAKEDGIKEGPICMFSVVEPCLSPWVYPNRESKLLELKMRPRKCVWIYFYAIDKDSGFGHMRIQSWLPFSIKGCNNGRHWLERQLISNSINYIKADNCFRWIEDVPQAQELMHKQLETNWVEYLETRRNKYFGILDSLFGDTLMNYYWSADETEWATDIMFNNSRKLDRLFPILARYGLLMSDSTSVLRFLGKIDADAKLPARISRGGIHGDRRRTYEGVRVKHWVGRNSVKVYNKAGSVLRVETTINNPRDFKVFRSANDDPERNPSWLPMRKGVADMHRRSEISQKSNERYLDAISGCKDDITLFEQINGMCCRIRKKGRSVRALNPWSKNDYQILLFLAQGQWHINGFRNKDLCKYLNPRLNKLDAKQKRRLSARTSYLLRMLRSHGLIRKVPKVNRYILTSKGMRNAALVRASSLVEAQTLMDMAA